MSDNQAPQPISGTAPIVTAGEAWQRLQAGNARFMAGNAQFPHESVNWRNGLEDGQRPFAVVVGCSDSRVPPELVFDLGFGDLFVIRVAGNVVDTDVSASVEFAVDHLDTRLIVVMGHTHCGAVTATVDYLDRPEGETVEVVSLLHRIETAVTGIPDDMTRTQRIEQGIKQNVAQSVRLLSHVPDLQRRIQANSIEVVGALYDIHTGHVELLT